MAGFGLPPPAVGAPPQPVEPPPPPDYGGLHPLVAQAIGLVPVPPPAAPAPPPVPVAPPAPEPVPAPPAAAPAPPVPEPGPAPAPSPVAVPPPVPAHPASVEQRLSDIDQQQRAATVASMRAVDQETAATAQKHADDLAAYQQHEAEKKRLAAEAVQIEDQRKKAFATSQAVIDADNRAIDSYKLDQNKYWNSLGLGQHVGMYIGMALSGLGNAFLGMNNPSQGAAPNPVIQMVQAKAKEAIAAQVDERERLKEKLGRDRQTQADIVQGFSNRQAEILRREGQADRALANQIALATAKSADPQTRARGEALKVKLWQEGLDKQEAAVKAQSEYEVHQQQLLNSRRQIGLGYAQLASAAEDRRLAREQRAEERAYERADKQEERDRQFAIGGVQRVEMGPDGKPVMGPDGKPKVVVDDLRNADGARWRAASPEEAGKLREKKTATTQLVKLYDRALALRDRVGGESSIGNSDEYQELKAIEAEIVALRKQGTHGMSSDADMEILQAASGAKDLTSFRARAAGINAARARVVDKFNQEMRDARYTGPAFDFPAPTPATNTTEEDRNQRLIQEDRETFDAVAKRELEKRTGGRPLDMGNPDDVRTSQEAFSAARANYDPGASSQQREDMAAIGAKARAGGPEAAAARAVLESVARGAHTARMRELARAELDALDLDKKPAPRGPSSRAVIVPDELRLPGAD